MNMTDEEDEDIMSKYWGVIDPVDNSVDYDTLASLVNEVKRLREENEYFGGLLDHYKRQCIDKHEEIQRYHKVFYDCVMNLSAAHQKETEQLRKELRILNGMNNALWNTVENYDICLDDFTMIDLFNPPEGYEFCEDEERWVKKNE